MSPGDFVIIQASLEEQCVRKILDIQIEQSIQALFEVQLYLFVKCIQDERVRILTLNASLYKLVGGMVEVIQTNQIRQVDASTIMDYAYIFHAETIQLG